jgi:hypothetical protein
MAIKTSTQFQQMTPWARSTLRDIGSEWYKWIDPGAGGNPCPEVPHAVLRVWTDDRDAPYIAAGREGGRQFVRDMLVRWRECPWATCYELANEPDCNSGKGLANLREYSIGAMMEADLHGIKVCILNLPEGNPGADPGLTGEAARQSERWKLEQLAEAVKHACDHGHYVGLHAYWNPAVAPDGPADRWHGLGRVVWNVEQWASMGVDLGKLQVLVGECGVDGALEGGSYQGWKRYYGNDYAAYAEQMVQAERYARQYPWMKALLYFVSGPNSDWASYDVDETLLRLVAPRLHALSGPSEPPSHALGPDPSVAYYHSERHGYAPAWIIVHDTEGPAEAALNWWRSPDNPYKSSAHYLIKADGEVIVCVPERLSAHHAGGGRWPGIPEGSTGGTSNINHVSIGIELEYPAAPASPPWPEAQLKAAAELLWHIANRHGIPRERVLTHAQVAPGGAGDPRNLDLEAFLGRVWPQLQPELPEDAIRNAAWNAKGIPYNPDAAFPRYAREHGLGNPETPEFDVTVDGVTYRAQGYASAVVFCRVGDWQNVSEASW